MDLQYADVDDMPILAQTEGIRSYEEICEDSRANVDVSDLAAWRIGDNAVEVLERFADKTLPDYAKEINKPKGTIDEYRRMSLYFPADVRAHFFDTCPNISRSHMRKVLSIKDMATGRAFVEKASTRGWTVDHFGFILKRYKALKGIGRKPAPRHVTVTPIGEGAMPAAELFDLIGITWNDSAVQGHEMLRIVVYRITASTGAKTEAAT